MSKILCIYHADCLDGFTAAWAVWRRFGKEAEYYPGKYGEAPPDVAGRHVIMVDFSYKLPVILKMAEQAASILILDHHKSAEEELKHLPPALKFWEEHIHGAENPAHAGLLDTVGVKFDMKKSGAVLAWQYFHPGKMTPVMLLHVQDRDLWQFKLYDTKQLTASILSRPFNFITWDGLVAGCENSYTRGKIIDEGHALLRQHNKLLDEMIPETKRMMVIGGYKVPVANLPKMLAADAGNRMSEGQPFAATYYDGRAMRYFSLRSKEGGVDVSEVAKKYGGGGHMHAAGFEVEIGWEGDPDWGTAGVP